MPPKRRRGGDYCKCCVLPQNQVEFLVCYNCILYRIRDISPEKLKRERKTGYVYDPRDPLDYPRTFEKCKLL